MVEMSNCDKSEALGSFLFSSTITFGALHSEVPGDPRWEF